MDAWLTCWFCVAGHISIAANDELIKGRLGRDLTVEEGYAAAHRVALSLLATIKSEFLGYDQL